MNARFFEYGEQLFDERRLHERFAARNGCTTAARKVILVFENARGDFFRRVLRSARRRPCVGVVAVQTAHGAPLHEHDEAYAGAVYRAERFKGMNFTRHARDLHKKRATFTR